MRLSLALALILVCALEHRGRAQAVPGDVDAEWTAFRAQWDGRPVTDARVAGAVGDGKVATDCSIAAGSSTLTCRSSQFTPADAGKVIAVYEAGRAFFPNTPRAMVQPLSTTIATVVSPTAVTLAAAATTAVTNSPRVVWGTDDTQALQLAVHRLATPGGTGGALTIPAGRYMVRGLSLPCSIPGTFFGETCPASYNRIWIRGAGRDLTALENWDVATRVEGILVLGRLTDTPFHSRALGDPRSNDRLSRIAISDLELRQVTRPNISAKTIASFASEDVWIVNTRGTGWSYECYVMAGGEAGRRWHVHDNVLEGCGHGGPAYPDGASALNLNGMDWVASRNRVVNSGQGVEMGSRRGLLTDNEIVVSAGSLAVNVGSTGSGVWSNIIARNRITGSISVSNSIGTINRTTIVDNTIVDGTVSIWSGAHSNTVGEEQQDTVVHGESVIRGNVLRYTAGAVSTGIGIGFDPPQGLESVLLEDNTFVCQCKAPPVLLSLSEYGAKAWRPRTVYAAGARADAVAPAVDNGFFYIAVGAGASGGIEPEFPLRVGALVTDGTVVWRNAGPRPRVTVKGLRVQGASPQNPLPKVRVQQTDRSRLQVEAPGIVSEFAWTLEHTIGLSEVVPAGVVYTDQHRFVAERPISGEYAAGTRLRRAASEGEGWVAIRAGRAAQVFTAGRRYGHGEFAVPPVDNGRVYVQMAAGGCAAEPVPTWPASARQIVRAGDCLWREAGPAVEFREANAIALDADAPLDLASPLAVVRTDPPRNAAGVRVVGPIAAVLASDVAVDAITTATFRLEACRTRECPAATPVAAKVAYAPAMRTATLAPNAALTPLGWYRARLGETSWTFRTAGPIARPRAAYSFSEGKGVAAADRSGNGHTAVRAGATWTPTGRFGGGVLLAGAGSMLTVAHTPALDLTTGVTIEAWVYPTAGPGNAVVVSKGSLRFGFVDGSLVLQATTNRGNVFVQSGPVVPANQWTHIAATYDGTTVALYLNGAPVPSGGPVAGGAIVPSTAPLSLGGAPGVPFVGRLDEVRIYVRPLSAVEIAADAAAPIG